MLPPTTFRRDPKMISRSLWSSAGKIKSTPGDFSGLKVIIVHLTLVSEHTSFLSTLRCWGVRQNAIAFHVRYQSIMRSRCILLSSFSVNLPTVLPRQTENIALSLALASYSLDGSVICFFPSQGHPRRLDSLSLTAGLLC